MMAGIGSKKQRLIYVFLAALLTLGKSVSGQTIQFFPIRTAPLGSPVGTVGDPVTPTFNESLNCWELKVPGPVEVDIDLQAFGWGDRPSVPTLGAVQAAVLSAGYDNGVGAPLNPKGWPHSPRDGAYQATDVCRLGDLSPCTSPFDSFCTAGGGFCEHNLDWIMPLCADDLPAMATFTLDYAWATAAQHDCNVDEGEVKTFGGLILEVPPGAAGTYVIAIDPDPNNTFLGVATIPFPQATLTSACITIIEGACCMDTNSDGQMDVCQDDTSESNCAAAAGLFAGEGSTCSGQLGACCFDGDLGGLDDTCTVMDRTCCMAEGGSFLGAGSSCGGQVGACCLDSDGDDFYDTCLVIDEACCDAQGGSFGAAGSRCLAFGGACCLDEGTCVEANATCCASQGGSSAGAGSACRGDANGNGTDDACEEGFPAVSEWGLVAMVLLLLVGIKICFARRRPIASLYIDHPV